MIRPILFAAIAAAAISLTAPTQAMPANPGLNAAVPAAVQLARYRHHSSRHHGWYHSYAYSPYRHCWTVRERTWGHHWRWIRHCR